MSEEGETKLERAQRHVREGLERLERQRTLISELIRDGHGGLVPAAQRFLAEMEQYQAEIEQHLQIVSRAGHGSGV
jgi:hypothetical protein